MVRNARSEPEELGCCAPGLYPTFSVRMLRDHELLGIDRDADPSEVRAAYIAALKRLHPDSSGTTQNAQQVSDLVSAYRRLRDSDRRRCAPAAGRQMSLRVTRRPYLVPLRPSTPIVFWGKALTLGLLAGALLAAALITYPDPTRRQAVAPVMAAAPAIPPEWSEPDEAVVRQAVGALQSFGPHEGAPAVEAHSRRCFAELESSPDPQLLDYCLAFDTAATQTNAVSREAPGGDDMYFHPIELRDRHVEALSRIVGDSRSRSLRRSRIESQTVSELASAVRVRDLDPWPR